MPGGSTLNGVSIAGKSFNSVSELINDLVPSKANFTWQGLGGFFSGMPKNFNLVRAGRHQGKPQPHLDLGIRYASSGHIQPALGKRFEPVANLPGTPW